MNDKATILAVDDTSESLVLLVKILTAAGYQVRPADSGELAMDAVATHLPDLILLDVRMKGMDGLEVCRRLKAAERTRHIPIILISAFADVKEWVAGLRLGAADYITKPFQPEELLMRVKTHLTLSRANVSLEQQTVLLQQANEQMQSEILKRKRVEDELRQNLDQAGHSRRVLLSAMEDRRQAEEEIKKQLAEKEILLKEVHHRIKNNIASISGLLSLRIHSITNPEAIAVLQDAIGRVDSMRILYDKLLLGKGYEDVSVKNYIESLADDIIALFPGSARIHVEKRIADFQLEPKRLFPLGLIINELLTNKMKYAFVGRKSGTIRISLANENGRVKLIMQDDGVGLPDGFDMENSKGFGLMLVNMLSQQLGGSFSIKNDNGTRSTLEFPL